MRVHKTIIDILAATGLILTGMFAACVVYAVIRWLLMLIGMPLLVVLVMLAG